MNRCEHRSFVLIAVLVVITGAVLVGTSMIFIAQGRVVETAGAADAAQMRALAWSGVQAVMSELNDQREQLLHSKTPRLDSQYTIYESESRAGIVRLLPMSADNQALTSPEAGKIDLNSATSGVLGLTGMIEPSSAEAIISFRDQNLKRPYQSVAELLLAPGAMITPQRLYGPLEELTPRDQAQQESMDLAERVAARLQTNRVRGLTDIVTVFSVEPVAQRDGKPRINLNQPWSEALGQQITSRFDAQVVLQVKTLMEQGTKFEKDGSIVKALIDAATDQRLWPDILDAFTTQPSEFQVGRLDINTAPLPALLTLPEITGAQAAQIISVRDQLSDDERSTIAWPVLSQVISPQTLVALADRITTRCFMYRLRVAAGEVNPDQPDGPMNNPVIFEVVIDLSSPKPRVAYMRDISVLQAAAQIALEATRTEPQFDIAQAPETGVSESLSEEAAPEASDAETVEPGLAASPDPQPADATQAPPASAKPAAPATARRIGRWLNGG